MGRLTNGLSDFELETRQTLRDMPVIAITGPRGNGIIPKVGFLARIHCHVSGVLTVTLGGGTAAIDVLGPWNMFQRVRTAINGGKEVFSASGYGAHLIHLMSGEQYFPEQSRFSPASDPSHSAHVYNVPTAAGANNWEFGFTIPIAPNDDEFLGGFILQVESAQSSLGFDFNTAVYSLTPTLAPVLVTGAATATFAGNITPMIESFDIPVDDAKWPPVRALHLINEVEQDVSQTGDLLVDLVKDNVYLQVLHHLVLNAAPTSTAVDRLKILIQRSNLPYDMPAKNFLQEQRRRYKRDLPAGVFVHDLFYQGTPNGGNLRDVIHARDLTEFQSGISISSGATLGTTRKLRTISRMLEPLQMPSSRRA